MLEARQRYQQALTAAGPDFMANNPGAHYFYEDDPTKVCVFCGCSEESAIANAPDGQAQTTCPGDLRRGG